MTATPTSKWKQWGWFVLLWLGGLGAVSVLSLIIKAIMNIGG